MVGPPSATDKRKQRNCGELSNSPSEPATRALLELPEPIGKHWVSSSLTRQYTHVCDRKRHKVFKYLPSDPIPTKATAARCGTLGKSGGGISLDMNDQDNHPPIHATDGSPGSWSAASAIPKPQLSTSAASYFQRKPLPRPARSITVPPPITLRHITRVHAAQAKRMCLAGNLAYRLWAKRFVWSLRS
jgi:hypothetical protein